MFHLRVLGDEARHGEEVLAAGHIALSTKQREGRTPYSAVSFRTPAHGVVTPTLRVGPPTSINLYNHSQACPEMSLTDYRSNQVGIHY